MKVTHFGHAAVLIETDASRRALVDPGTYSTGFEGLTDLDLVVLTHGHPDHVDAPRLTALREANPSAILIANPEAAETAGGARAGDHVVSEGSAFDVAGLKVEPTGAQHATIYPALPPATNTGFILDDRIWHPGDAFDAEPRLVDVLLLPVGGPWMKVAEAIDFAKAVAPRVIVPIHQAGLAEVHQQLHYQLLHKFAPGELIVLDEGVPQEV